MPTTPAAPHRPSPARPRRLVPLVVALLWVTTWLAGSPPGGAAAASTADGPAAGLTTDADPAVLGPTVRFAGRGYGHGVGLSQYGARGRALAGQDAATILAHYYQGTTLGSISTSTAIRVRVLWRWTAAPAAPLVIVGRVRSWTIDGVEATFPVGAILRVIPATTVTADGTATTWRIQVSTAAGTVLHGGPKPVRLVVRSGGKAGRLQLVSKAATHDRYRGALHVIASPKRPRVKVVNDLPLETYLRGVVPAEMPSSWPAAALEAQAIAARSYAARRLRPGVSSFDVTDTSSSQVYLGAKGERASTDAVIAATAGVVLRSGSAIANALFHSTGGGATENNENVFTSSTGAKVASPVSYLRGSPDIADDGTAYDAAAPFATWRTKAYDLDELSAWLAADPRTDVGQLTALDLSRRGVSGRLIRVTLVGTTATKVVSGEVVRAVFNAARPVADPPLRSTLFWLDPAP